MYILKNNVLSIPLMLAITLKECFVNNSCALFQSRLMQTIGVARGFGDHDLRLYDSNIFMKPFLSAYPEVWAKYFLYPISYKSLKFLLSPYNLEKKKRFSFRKLILFISLITLNWMKSY